jgi:restriction endonuclease Mrr
MHTILHLAHLDHQLLQYYHQYRRTRERFSEQPDMPAAVIEQNNKHREILIERTLKALHEIIDVIEQYKKSRHTSVDRELLTEAQVDFMTVRNQLRPDHHNYRAWQFLREGHERLHRALVHDLRRRRGVDTTIIGKLRRVLGHTN